MKFESAQVAAMRLGVSVRAVQKWAKQGKIPRAYKSGRDWLIPIDSVKPSDFGDGNITYANEPLPIIHPYKVGRVFDYINNIEDPDDKAMALYLSRDVFVVSLIYLHIVAAMDYINLRGLFCIFFR